MAKNIEWGVNQEEVLDLSRKKSLPVLLDFHKDG